jgi:regulator of sigma E protease
MIIIIFLVSLSVLVLVHEFGHFFVAKRVGVQVEEFGLGFPPSLYRWRRGITVYSLNLLLFGGFVKLTGEDNPDIPNGFLAQPAIKKIVISLAGILLNLFLAYFLFSFGYLVGLPEFDASLSNVTILRVLPNSPAAASGLQLGDQLLALKDQSGKIVQFQQPTTVKNLLGQYAGQKIELLIQRGHEKFWRSVTPQSVDRQDRGPLGIYIGSVVLVRHSFPSNFIAGLKRTLIVTQKITLAFLEFIVNLFRRQASVTEVVGPLGIFDVYQQMRTLGFGYLFHFWGLISLNLAILNLLPLPALDGWRVLTYSYEGLRRRPLSRRFELITNQVGFILLILLLLIVTIKDIAVKFQP